jgi:hypothetical protein
MAAIQFSQTAYNGVRIKNNFDEELTVTIQNCKNGATIISNKEQVKTCNIKVEGKGQGYIQNNKNIIVSSSNVTSTCDVTMAIKGHSHTVTVKISDYNFDHNNHDWCNIDPRDQCFPGDAKIKIKDNQSCININIEDVKIGDNILVGPNKYRPVIGFSHKNSISEFDFLCIKYETNDPTNDPTKDETNNTLHMTSGHFIPASKSKYDKLVYIPAAELKVGMFIQNINNDKINLVKIKEISNVKKIGLFCIHTDNYNVVVDNIIVSSYTSSININFAHTLISIANIFPLTISAYLIENIPALRLFLLKKENYFGLFILIIMTLLLKLIG